MLGRTHQVGGVSAAFITSTILYTKNYPVLMKYPLLMTSIVAGGVLGSLMPDIDHPNSMISRVKILGIPILKPLAWLINVLFGHRGATHTLWALIFTWLPFVIGPIFLPEHLVVTRIIIALFGLGYATGYFSHLLLDSMTPSGAPIFWPFQSIHLAKLPTGKYDTIVSFFLSVITGVVCGGLLYISGIALPILT